MGAQIVGASPGITLPELEGPPVDGADVTGQKNIRLERIFAVVKFSRDNLKPNIQLDIRAATLGVDQIGDTPGISCNG
ncbi:MAG: hypothetical protein P8010_19075 [Desulfosarcinaceae bacterium]